MPKRSYATMLILAVVTVALAACGGGEATALPAETVAQATEVRAATVVAEAETPRPTAAASPTAPPPTVVAEVDTPRPTAAASPTVPPPTVVAEVDTPRPTSATASPTVPPPTVIAGLNGATPVADLAVVTSADDELTTVEVVKRLTPSVVQIVTEAVTMGFFNQPVPSQGVGSGVILDTEGHILSNNHVVAGAQQIIVTLSSGESFPASVVGTDPSTDTAVVRISAPELQPAELGNSSALQIGEDVIAIGHALGLKGGPTVTKGVVSARGRSIEVDPVTTIVDLIQTDAAINPGNSGGALVNTRAEVVGINTAIIPGSQGIGFAINIDDVKVVVQQLLDTGTVRRGFLGINPFNLNPGLANQLRVPVVDGVAVAAVTRGTEAAAAGLRVGDVIVQLGDDPIRNTGELSKFLMKHLPGETVDIVYYRLDVRVRAKITLGAPPAR